jgi:hypothetical protein
MFVIAIDPGKVKMGYAFGEDKTKSPVVGTFTHKPAPGEDGYLLSTSAAKAFLSAAPAIGTGPILICMERMQVDSRTAGKEENLLEVAMTGAAVVLTLASYCSALGYEVRIWSPTPGEWKKQVPKAVMHERLKTAYPDLDLSRAGHDALDALGLFAWASRQATLPVPFKGDASVFHASR